MDQPELRKKAELEALAPDPLTVDKMSPEETQKILHDLKIHKIELEMQNEELRRTSADLEISQSRYVELYDLAPVGYMTLSQTGAIVQSNLKAASLLSQNRQTLVNKMFSQFIRPGDQDLYYLHRKKLFETAQPQRLELRLISKAPLDIWIQLDATLECSRSGEKECRMTLIDITQSKAEESLRFDQSYLFQESQKAAHIGSYKVDFVQGTWQSSEVLDDIFGIDESYPRTIPGWLAFVVEEDQEMMNLYLQSEVIEKKKPFDKAYRIRRPSDGQERWVHGLGKVDFDHNYQPLTMIGTIMDITVRKKNEDLIQNSQRLESLGILAGGIAHDFNNLLTGLLGFVDLARGASTEERVRNYLNKAMGASDRARALASQLLTFSKGGQPVKKANSLVPFLQETISFALSGSAIKCQYDLDPQLWLCSFDNHQLAQVIDNLIINASQAMPLGGTITVQGKNVKVSENQHSTLNHGNYVKISIIDQGIGIPSHLLTHIFDPYFTTKSNGHGLGLATCFSIISKHGGALEAESQDSHGSTFHIWLPAATEQIDHKGLPVIQNHRGSGIFIVMDDEALILESTCETLKSLGYTTKAFTDGQTVLDFLLAPEFRWDGLAGMILDLTIPGGLGGAIIVKEIRKMNPTVPIFACSGYSNDPIMSRPQEFGFTSSLPKPFTFQNLSDLLNLHISESQPSP